MTFPEELKYSRNDEWVKMLDATTALVGITDYAQNEMGGLVFINLPVAGDTVTKGEALCDIESVKAVSDVIPFESAPFQRVLCHQKFVILFRVMSSKLGSRRKLLIFPERFIAPQKPGVCGLIEIRAAHISGISLDTHRFHSVIVQQKLPLLSGKTVCQHYIIFRSIKAGILQAAQFEPCLSGSKYAEQKERGQYNGEEQNRKFSLFVLYTVCCQSADDRLIVIRQHGNHFLSAPCRPPSE